MATVTTATFAADSALAVSTWDSDLTSGLWATSAIFDNSSTGYVDATAGGFVDFTGTSAVAGDTIDIYITMQYSDTSTDMGGAIDALLGPDGIEAADTSFIAANLTFVTSISLHGTPTTVIGYHWAAGGLAQYFGGVLPKRFMFLCHANTASSLAGAATGNLNVVGITYTNT